jgi:hypothetical protein
MSTAPKGGATKTNIATINLNIKNLHSDSNAKTENLILKRFLSRGVYF